MPTSVALPPRMRAVAFDRFEEAFKKLNALLP